uniref:Uncharacterized protein n=1 Tax=Romanomermis culicivorax TaxID=13658 RepID=A0A915JV75_ROMCU
MYLFGPDFTLEPLDPTAPCKNSLALCANCHKCPCTKKTLGENSGRWQWHLSDSCAHSAAQRILVSSRRTSCYYSDDRS